MLSFVLVIDSYHIAIAISILFIYIFLIEFLPDFLLRQGSPLP